MAWRNPISILGVQVRVGKWLTDLEKNFYGSSLAYDNVRSSSYQAVMVLARNVCIPVSYTNHVMAVQFS